MSNIISIDLEESYFKAKLKLCRPNRQPIDNMVDISDRKLHVRLGNIHDLSFSVPYYVTRNHKKVKNPLLDKIKLGYLVQLDFKNEREYFVIMDDSKSMDSNGDTITFNLKSLAYRLGKFDVREFEVEAYPLSQIMLGTTAINGILAETNWTLGHVDVDFDLTYRSISISTSTVLQAVFDVAEKFGAVPDFDTVNRKINFIKMESTGFNKGFKSTEGKYLESYGIDTTLDEIVTRLKCYGEEGLEFRNLSPVGANYLQDFSYFMYGFECDSNYNVISSSEYGMSDSLCIALTRYNNLVNDKNNEFDTLTSQKTTKQAELVQLQQELSVLTTEKKMLEHQLDLINITYADQARTRTDWQDLNTQLNSKLSSITVKENQVTSKEDEITSIENSIISLGQLLSTENNFTEEQLHELKDYIYVKEFSDTSIVDEEDLLKAGIEQFRKYREPKVTLKLDLVDFTNDFEYQADKKKINLGDITTFFSKRLNVEIQSRITEIEYDLDELNISLTISNDINKTTDEDILADLLKNVSSTSLTLDMNMYKLDLAKNANTMVNHLLEAAYDTGKNILLGGLANTNEMTERGFYSRDYYDPTNTFLVINGGGLYITKDSARSVEVAINKDGVHSRRLVGNIVLSNKVMVESTSGIVTIEDNAITIKDTAMSNRVILGRYANPSTPSQYKYGLYVSDGAVDIRTTSVANRGMQMDANGLRAFNSNGVRTFEIDATYGDMYFEGNIASSTITASTIQTTATVNRGLKITNSGLSLYNSSGTRTVYLNAANGDAEFTGAISGSTISGATITGGSISGTSITGITFSGNSFSGATITGSSITGNTISGGTVSGTTITGNTISGGTITGATITGGIISSNTRIEVDTNLYVGDRIYIQGAYGSTDFKGIYFGRYSYDPYIAYGIIGLQIGGANTTFVDNVTFANRVYFNNDVRYTGTVDFTGATVTGITSTGGVTQSYVQTYVSSALSGYASQSYVGFTIANAGYATQSYVSSAISNAGYATTSYVTNSLSPYATRTWIRTNTVGTPASTSSSEDLYLAYSSSTKRLYLRVGGSTSTYNVGYVTLI